MKRKYFKGFINLVKPMCETFWYLFIHYIFYIFQNSCPCMIGDIILFVIKPSQNRFLVKF